MPVILRKVCCRVDFLNAKLNSTGDAILAKSRQKEVIVQKFNYQREFLKFLINGSRSVGTQVPTKFSQNLNK